MWPSNGFIFAQVSSPALEATKQVERTILQMTQGLADLLMIANKLPKLPGDAVARTADKRKISAAGKANPPEDAISVKRAKSDLQPPRLHVAGESEEPEVIDLT